MTPWGHVPISLEIGTCPRLRKTMRSAKIKSFEALLKIRARLRREGKTIVFTNGCFDLIHGGHVHLFRTAKKSGDILIVALNTDASIRKNKGPSRPIFPLSERFEVLAAFADIDYLTAFPEPTPRAVIAALRPDVLVKGGDREQAPLSDGPRSRPRGEKSSASPISGDIRARTSSKKF